MNKRLYYGWAALVLLSLVAGCGHDQSLKTDTPAGLVVARSIQAHGGLDRLSRVEQITAVAIVRVYDETGAQAVAQYNLVIEPNERTIRATGRVPEGAWQASAKLGGGGSVDTQGDLEITDRQEQFVVDTLRLILHRLRGPMNLMDAAEQVVALEQVYAGGQLVDRVLSSGRPDLASAYFFDPETGLLRFVTVGDYEAPGEGTVTMLSYKRAYDGLFWPTSIEVVEMGKNSFVGDRRVLDVSLSELQVQ